MADRIELTKEECLADGMSEKEYEMQKALGSLPTKMEFMWDNVLLSLCANLFINSKNKETK